MRKKIVLVFIFSVVLLNTVRILGSTVRGASTDVNLSPQNGTPVIKFYIDGIEQSGFNFIQNSTITMVIEDTTYSTIDIEFWGTTTKYSGSFRKGEVGFYFLWNTKQPTLGGPAVLKDEYEIRLIINGQTVIYGNKIQIIDPPLDLGPILIILVVIIVAVVVGGGGTFIVLKKKGNKQDVDFDSGDEIKKKRGEIYSGASQIGKSSGILAEKKKMEAKGEKPSYRPSLTTSTRPAITTPKLSTTTPAAPAGGMNFIDDKKKFESTMYLKQQETSMDLDTRLNFLMSKSDSINQNVALFKFILESLPSEIHKCPKCKSIINPYWARCPYCEIKDSESELAMEQSMIAMEQGVRLCPSCKNLIKPSWPDCPHCMVNK